MIIKNTRVDKVDPSVFNSFGGAFGSAETIKRNILFSDHNSDIGSQKSFLKSLILKFSTTIPSASSLF